MEERERQETVRRRKSRKLDERKRQGTVMRRKSRKQGI